MAIGAGSGVAVTTHSMIRAFEACPNATRYTYAEKLLPRLKGAGDKPLERGTWFHKLLEAYYSGQSWVAAHDKMVEKYNGLFLEEQEALGDLPTDMNALMRSYLWHYGSNADDPYHGWTVHAAEQMLECEWPDGSGIYRMKYDMLVEDDRGLWLVDHKTHLSLPDTTFRLLDKASTLYVWCARQNGIPVNGFIWNYVVPKAPTKPKLVDKGKRLSKVKVATDYPTVVRALKEYELDIEPYKPWLRELKQARWNGPDSVQTSDFFRRDILQKEDDHTERVVRSVLRTVHRLQDYNYDEDTERSIGRGCSWCRHRDLCTTELIAGPDSAQVRNIRKQHYRTGDPLAYYSEEK